MKERATQRESGRKSKGETERLLRQTLVQGMKMQFRPICLNTWYLLRFILNFVFCVLFFSLGFFLLA